MGGSLLSLALVEFATAALFTLLPLAITGKATYEFGTEVAAEAYTHSVRCLIDHLDL